jgi:hypothetical protein
MREDGMTEIEELAQRLRSNTYMSDDTRIAADALTALQRENEILRAERDQARAQREFCVKVLTRIHSFIAPEDVVLPDGRRFEFKNIAIEHEMLKGLAAAIRAVPDELKKAESAQSEDEWPLDEAIDDASKQQGEPNGR